MVNKMWESIKIGLVLVLVAITCIFIGIANADETEPILYGLKWGMSIEELDPKGQDSVSFRKEGEYTTFTALRMYNKKIGNVEPKDVYYELFNNQLCNIIFSFKGDDNCEVLLNALILKYGKGKENNYAYKDMQNVMNNTIGFNCGWSINGIVIVLQYNYMKDEGFLTYSKTSYYENARKEKKESIKDTAKDL